MQNRGLILRSAPITAHNATDKYHEPWLADLLSLGLTGSAVLFAILIDAIFRGGG